MTVECIKEEKQWLIEVILGEQIYAFKEKKKSRLCYCTFEGGNIKMIDIFAMNS